MQSIYDKFLSLSQGTHTFRALEVMACGVSSKWETVNLGLQPNFLLGHHEVTKKGHNTDVKGIVAGPFLSLTFLLPCKENKVIMAF